MSRLSPAAILQMTDSAQNPSVSLHHPTDDRAERRTHIILGLLFGSMSVLAAIDAKLDVRDRLDLPHVLVEETILVLGVVGVLVMWRRLAGSLRRERHLRDHADLLSVRLVETEHVLRAEADDLAARLAQTEREALRWKKEAGGLLAGLGVAIDAQFDRWEFSPAERDIGLLLLKGLSHKEIARIRTVSEATVRQQSQRLYRKAHVSSRNDLAAFFLEDLLLPSTQRAKSAKLDDDPPAASSNLPDPERVVVATRGEGIEPTRVRDSVVVATRGEGIEPTQGS